MSVLRHLYRAVFRFARSDTGSFSVETVMMVPLLLFAYAGLFTYFDAFRTLNLNIRGGYTIADTLSRETDEITPDYMEGLNDVLSVLTQSQYDTVLRVTVVSWEEDDEAFELVWSDVAGGTGNVITPLTAGTLSEITDDIPPVADEDVAIVVQTWAGFVPMMKWIGVEPQYFENLVVTRPRFAPQLKYNANG